MEQNCRIWQKVPMRTTNDRDGHRLFVISHMLTATAMPTGTYGWKWELTGGTCLPVLEIDPWALTWGKVEQESLFS